MKFLVALTFIFVSLNSFSQDSLTVVAVGEAELEKEKMSFMAPQFGAIKQSEKNKINSIIKTLKDDFDFYRHLFEVNKETLTQDPGKASRYVMYSIFSVVGKEIFGEFKLKDNQKNLYVYTDKKKVWMNNIRTFSHDLADDMYRSITGNQSIFKSKILFLSDRTSPRNKANKEIYLMDFDGKRKQRITYDNGMIISPSLSPNNDKVLYTVVETEKKIRKSDQKIRKVKNLNLYLFDLKRRTKQKVSAVKGINSGAVFNKTGDSIYLTLSNLKNADIYKMNLKTKKKRRVTKHFSDDVDPHINADESLMTFLSGRPGKAMIYTMDPNKPEKGNVKRISFVGRFNAAPRFNPAGTEIVFSSWVDNRFDIFRIGSDGTNLVRLTKDFGSNEEPWFSPDGQFIVFTSQRVISRKKAVQDVYIMNRDGEIIKRITSNYGKIYTPRWSN